MQRLTPILLVLLSSASPQVGLLVPSAIAQPASPAGLSEADLEELLAPIALYPDPLLANVLAAACYPDELMEAKQANGNAATIDAASWEPAVKAVAKIPDLIGMLTQYPEWTTALGEAFILQSQDVMAAAQRLRARAYANGALQTTEQQVVTSDNDTIVIVPAQPDVIYVPTYNPSVVYVDNDDDELLAGVIGFGIGITAGIIIGNNMDCDWYGGGCCFGCGWGHWGGGNDVNININNNNVNINNIKNNGNRWKANETKINQGIRNGQPRALNSYRGVGTGRSNASIPSREANAKPIAQRPAPRPSQLQSRPNRDTSRETIRTNQVPSRPQSIPAKRPDSMKRPEMPKARPSVPPSVPPVVQNPTGSHSPTGVRTRQSLPPKRAINAFDPNDGAANRGASSRGGGSRGTRKGR